VKPVLDIAGLAPVDAYEIRDRYREAVQPTSPADIFPFASSTRRTGDLDHTLRYVPPDEGGPPGQTRIGNLGRNDQATSQDQGTQSMAGQTAVSRHLHLAVSARALLARRPHRHPPPTIQGCLNYRSTEHSVRRLMRISSRSANGRSAPAVLVYDGGLDHPLGTAHVTSRHSTLDPSAR
jgi:hypothetical protein